MTIYSCLLVAAIVWLISLIRSVRLRAAVYSLPLPITAVLFSTSLPVDSTALFGVVLLNLFFAVVSFLYQRAGWHILLADAGGIAAYCIVGIAAARAGGLSFSLTLAAVVVLWVAAVQVFRPSEEATVVRPRQATSKAVKLAAILAGSVATLGLSTFLGGLVVAFPYAGILVAIESRHDLPQFSKHFARNSIGLVAFFSAYHYTYHGSVAVSMVVAWIAFLICLLFLNLRRPARRQAT